MYSSDAFMFRRRILVTLFFLSIFLSVQAYAQKVHTAKGMPLTAVPNDSAANAYHLTLNAPYHKSTTTGCTLEEHCLNKPLTSKCLVYHNDQWFTFTTSGEPVYYLIVRNQNCRDINGVQLLVMDGALCRPATYEIIACVSLSTQDDIALTLSNLKNDHTYILNLDGYLNDLCRFEIRVSTTPPEFHLDLSKRTGANYRISNDSIHMGWQLTEELQSSGITHFEIARRFQTEKRSSLRHTIPAERLVTGIYKTDYVYTDTVRNAGIYHYKIIAVSVSGERYLLNEFSVAASPVFPVKNPNQVKPELELKRNTQILVEVYTWADKKLLTRYKTRYVPGEFMIDLDPYFKENQTFRLRVVISDIRKKFKQEFTIDRKF